MTDSKKVFLDSNILIYLLDKDTKKKETVEDLLRPDQYISTQVVSENVNVCLKKLKLSKELSFAHGRELLNLFNVITIDSETIRKAFQLSERYQLGFWDSLIIATALLANCEIIYSEDLQNGLLIEDKLKIVNPFNLEN